VREVAYIFERFPSFGQTFCYREVAELKRQGVGLHVFSLRRPMDEPEQDWDPAVARQVHYLPEEKELVSGTERTFRQASMERAAEAVREWGRQSDFLRLYQAAYIGARLQASGVRRVHAHFAGMATRTAYWIQQFFGIAYTFTAHANDVFAPRPFAIGLDTLVNSAAAVVAVSDFGADFLRKQYPGSAQKICRIYNGVDLTAFPRATYDGTVPKIVSVGRLIKKKGFADLIAACAQLSAAGVQFTCDIVGEGPLEKALAEQIATAELEQRVKLVGPETQHQIARRLACATVFALPCKVEAGGGMDNLPTVIMEAMAAGLPVISTRVAGVPEMVGDGITGLLVPPGDVTALMRAMRELLENRQRAQLFGANGHAIAREKFSIENSARALRDLFAATE
jgi:colanic acid/amylovoran biosynthesis glycosyltransferase